MPLHLEKKKSFPCLQLLYTNQLQKLHLWSFLFCHNHERIMERQQVFDGVKKVSPSLLHVQAGKSADNRHSSCVLQLSACGL